MLILFWSCWHCYRICECRCRFRCVGTNACSLSLSSPLSPPSPHSSLSIDLSNIIVNCCVVCFGTIAVSPLS